MGWKRKREEKKRNLSKGNAAEEIREQICRQNRKRAEKICRSQYPKEGSKRKKNSVGWSEKRKR